MNLFSSRILFFALTTISGMNIFYIFIRGMAPGASALKSPFTRFFLYSPNPGFFWLVESILISLILQIYVLVSKKTAVSLVLNQIAWITLILALTIECSIIADFQGLF
jgi:uncharacterized membrane protein